jgi:hypothetical protein
MMSGIVGSHCMLLRFRSSSVQYYQFSAASSFHYPQISAIEIAKGAAYEDHGILLLRRSGRSSGGRIVRWGYYQSGTH